MVKKKNIGWRIRFARAISGGVTNNIINHKTFKNRQNLIPRVSFLYIQAYVDDDKCDIQERHLGLKTLEKAILFEKFKGLCRLYMLRYI